MSDLKACPKREPRAPTPYQQTKGSGWFWCHGKNGWMVLYVNALWGARVDGHYVRMSNFDDAIGPLEEPND